MKTIFCLALLLGLASATATTAHAEEAESPNYLYIMKFAIPPGTVPADAVETVSKMVRIMRKSGDWKSVRMFFHDTGPDVALYTLAEPNDWAAIETGNATMVEEMDIMNTPFMWVRHTDNILVEMAVD